MVLIFGSVIALVGAAMGQTTLQPIVVATVPSSGAVVPAGDLRVSVTFDRPMRPGGYSFVAPHPAAFPNCDRAVVQSPDRRTFSMRCRVQSGRAYEIGINGVNFNNFVSDDTGTPAHPVTINFSVQ
ncbi:MAG: hypothetical protein K2X25_05910 [Caulobacteraceae bacterium]|nr:hypothetical protein [Caulobacteraceae bacterium]